MNRPTTLTLFAVIPPLAALVLLASASSSQTVKAKVWIPLDGVAAQVGDRIITFGELRRITFAGQPDISTADELRAAMSRDLERAVQLRMQAQAGEDLGVDPTRVDLIVSRLQEQRLRQEGAAALAARFEIEGLDPMDAAADTRRQIYAQHWRLSARGLESLAVRESRERFVRPGLLSELYRTNRGLLARPPEVQFQILDLNVAAVGGAEAASTLADALMGRARAGEDFGLLVEEFGSTMRDTFGVTERYPITLLKDARLARFASSAAVGEFTGPLAIPEQGPPAAFRLAKLLVLEPGAPAPPFVRRDVQKVLSSRFQAEQDERMIRRAVDKLEASTFVWRHPRIAPATPSVDS